MGTFGESLGMTDPTWKEENLSAVKNLDDSRRQRDIYKEMMLLENPDFSCIPIQDIRSAINTSPPSKQPKSTQAPYTCATQQTGTIEELFIGLSRGNITLWETGSVINWIARFDGFPSRKHAIDAAVATFRAAQQWNKVLDGRVTFRYVTRFDDAAFQLVYGGDLGRVLASAFFPDMWRRALNEVSIYQLQFSCLWQIPTGVNNKYD